MTDVKIPEPHLAGGSFIQISKMQGSSDGFTEAQLKQYGDDRAREALEMAAKVAKKYNHPIAGVIANEIRAVAKEIE